MREPKIVEWTLPYLVDYVPVSLAKRFFPPHDYSASYLVMRSDTGAVYWTSAYKWSPDFSTEGVLEIIAVAEEAV